MPALSMTRAWLTMTGGILQCRVLMCRISQVMTYKEREKSTYGGGGDDITHSPGEQDNFCVARKTKNEHCLCFCFPRKHAKWKHRLNKMGLEMIRFYAICNLMRKPSCDCTIDISNYRFYWVYWVCTNENAAAQVQVYILWICFCL